MSRSRKIRDMATGLGLCFPFLALYTVFTIWPVIQGLYVSLHKWSLMGKVKFVGLDNYIKFLSDQKFIDALKHTIIFVALSVPFLVIMALILALFANRPVKIRRGLRIAFYLPSIISVSVASFIAKYMFAPYMGFVNGILHLTGLLKSGAEIQWLIDTNHAWAVVTIMTVWWTVGFPCCCIYQLCRISPLKYTKLRKSTGCKMAAIILHRPPASKTYHVFNRDAANYCKL